MVPEEVFVNHYNFNLITKVQKGFFQGTVEIYYLFRSFKIYSTGIL
jgi:hypothetical protein